MTRDDTSDRFYTIGHSNHSMEHRRLLITKVLFERGVDVARIRGNGTVTTEAEVRAQEEAARDHQLDLFGGDAPERERPSVFKIPNAKTRAAMAEAETITRKRRT